MRRIVVFLLTLFAGMAVSAQELTPLRFGIGDIQISPDGRHAVFSIFTSLGEGVEPRHLEEEYFKEIFLLELDTGTVKPLALQPYGPRPCYQREPDKHVVRQSACRIYTQPIFLADSSHVVWGGIWSAIMGNNTTSTFFNAVQWYEFETQDLYTSGDQSLLIPWVDVVVLPPYLIQGSDSMMYITTEFPILGGVKLAGRVYDFSEFRFRNGNMKKTFMEFQKDFEWEIEQPPIHWIWADYDGKVVLVGGGNNGQWYVYDFEAATITETSYSPVAEMGDETLTYVWMTEGENSSPRWQLTTSGSILSAEETKALIDEYTNRKASDAVLVALGQALTAEFGETGFSLHPGMTLILDELRIYEIMAVEREDTLRVPLEWRLVQPPEGESQPLNAYGPIPFPGMG